MRGCHARLLSTACSGWRLTSAADLPHRSCLAILAEVHAAQPMLLRGATTDESYAELHSRLAAAVLYALFGDAGAGGDADWTATARDTDGQLHIHPG